MSLDSRPFFRPYYWCQKEPIKRNQCNHFFRSLVILHQMRAIVGNFQQHHSSGKQAFSNCKYWSVLAIVQARQIGESKSSAKSGVSWNSFGFSATYSLKYLSFVQAKQTRESSLSVRLGKNYFSGSINLRKPFLN